jgi:DNA (cytosine-5)-methyltransferase 1
MAERLGLAIRANLIARDAAGPSTQEIARLLADWFNSLTRRTVPWLRGRSRWQVICAEFFLDRLSATQVRSLWPLLARWETPADTLAAQGELREIAKWLERNGRAERILELARQVASSPEELDDDEAIHRIPGLNEALADLAVLAVPTGREDESEEPVLVSRGVLRVVARFTGEHVDRRNRLSDGRLATARMIGDGNNARDAHLGLVELAAAICRPSAPLCVECPLAEICYSSQADSQRQSFLF